VTKSTVIVFSKLISSQHTWQQIPLIQIER